MNRRRYTILGITIVLICSALTVAVWPRDFDTTAKSEHDFVIDEGFTRVRKILVRTNAVKRIVAMTNAEFLDQSWLNVSLDVKQLFQNPDWKVGGEGKLKVRTADPYVGEHEIELDQVVSITVDRLAVTSRLSQPVQKLRDYETTTTAEGTEQESNFHCALTLTVRTQVSPLFRHVARRRVHEAARNALEGQEQAIRQTIAEHRNDLIILPKLSF